MRVRFTLAYSLAGADIAEMEKLQYKDVLGKDYLSNWQSGFRAIRKPIIAAVNGYAVKGYDLS